MQKITKKRGSFFHAQSVSIRYAAFAILVASTGLATPTARAQTEWVATQKLTPDNGAPDDWFGSQVVIKGNIGIISALGRDDLGESSGSAYLFDVSTGEELHQLVASDGRTGALLGFSVDIDGHLGIVGAPGEIIGPNAIGPGAAYLFDTGNGEEILKLTASDGRNDDRFGRSVAIEGNLALVGAPFDDAVSGSAYLFDIATGTQLMKLTASDRHTFNYFGSSVALSGNLAVVGAWANDSRRGAAYIFDLTTGGELFKLVASDGQYSDYFGFSVAISGDRAIIGAPFEGDFANYHSKIGSVYVFDLTTGEELLKLGVADPTENEYFGWSVALKGDRAVIGAVLMTNHRISSGAAYLFDIATGEELFKFTSADGEYGDNFGRSVSISGNRIAIGVMRDDDRGEDSGSVYIFEPACLRLEVDQFMAGDLATWTISKGTPNATAAVVYGFLPGVTRINGAAGYCAAFGIRGIDQNRLVCQKQFDVNGRTMCRSRIPDRAFDQRVFVQAAERDTCPDTCMSNLLDLVAE